MKITKILIPIILIVIIGVFFLFASKNEKSIKIVTPVTETIENKDKAIETKPETQSIQPKSRYIIHSQATFEQFIGKKRILFFYANWCPTCRPVNNDLLSNFDKIPQDFIVIRINYNDTETDTFEKELAKKYSITYQHTFVQIDEDGNEITKWNGGDFENLLNRIK